MSSSRSATLNNLSTDVIRPMRNAVTLFAGKVTFEDKPPLFAAPAHVTDETDATSSTTGSITVAGGASAQKDVRAGGRVVCYGSLSVAGGADVVGSLSAPAGRITCGGDLAAPSGGVGVDGPVRAGGAVDCASAVTCAGGARFDGETVAQGALTVGGATTCGGIGAAAALAVGGNASASSGGVGVAGGLTTDASVTAGAGCKLTGGAACAGPVAATGALAANAGASIAKDAETTGAATVAGALRCDAAVASTTAGTGAVVVAGGASVAGTATLGSQLRLDAGAPVQYKNAVFRARVHNAAYNPNGLYMAYTPVAGGRNGINFPMPVDCERNTRVSLEVRLFTDGPAGDYAFGVDQVWMTDGDLDILAKKVSTSVTATLQTNVVTHVKLFEGLVPDTDAQSSLLVTPWRSDSIAGNLWFVGWVLWYETRSWGSTHY